MEKDKVGEDNYGLMAAFTKVIGETIAKMDSEDSYSATETVMKENGQQRKLMGKAIITQKTGVDTLGSG